MSPLVVLFSTLFLLSSAFPTTTDSSASSSSSSSSSSESAENAESAETQRIGSEFFRVMSSEVCRNDAARFEKCFVVLKDLAVARNRTEPLSQQESIEWFDVSKSVFKCLGDISCGPLAVSVYMMKANLFIFERESEAADCLQSSDLPKLRDVCDSELSAKIHNEVALKIHTARCVANTLNGSVCSREDRNNYLRAEFARLESQEMARSLFGDKKQPDLEAVSRFDSKFDPEPYFEIEL